MKLKAYKVHELDMPVVPAKRSREWMDSLPEAFANRCLPLRIANEAGWWILNSHTFEVVWEGLEHQTSLKVEYHDTEKPYPASTHFGNGILTFSIPWLFQTEEGYNLHVRGPANLPKPDCCPLEGIVEADWAPYTFTMNWQITQPWEPIVFEKGEPICQIVPVRRGELEAFEPEFGDESDSLIQEYAEWAPRRTEFLTKLFSNDAETVKKGWQRDYFQARGTEEHQTKLKLKDFS